MEKVEGCGGFKNGAKRRDSEVEKVEERGGVKNGAKRRGGEVEMVKLRMGQRSQGGILEAEARAKKTAKLNQKDASHTRSRGT